MKSLIYLSTLLYCVVNAQPSVQAFDMEVTTSMLGWSQNELGERNVHISNALKKWKKEFSEEKNYFAEIDIDGDKANEMIIAGGDFPTRGRAYLLLKKQSGKWVSIAYWRGGFIFHKESIGVKIYDLHTFEKINGEMYYSKNKFKNGKYINDFATLMPRTLYDSTFYDKWKILNSIEIAK